MTQTLVDEICNVIGELKLGTIQPGFIKLFNAKGSLKHSSDQLILYEADNNYYLFKKQRPGNKTSPINNLINCEVLDIVAKLCYATMGVPNLSDDQNGVGQAASSSQSNQS